MDEPGLKIHSVTNVIDGKATFRAEAIALDSPLNMDGLSLNEHPTSNLEE